MRVAIVASPRTGNSWLKKLLVDTLELPEYAVHNWHEVADRLPESCVLAVHWYREPEFQAFLRGNGFKIITIARHPLDAMLSILRFCKYDRNTARWLEGNGDLECLFEMDLTPLSPVFLDWCAGFGCENLLSISYQWFHERDAIKVRYEDLLRDPRETINAISSQLAGAGVSIPDAVLEKYHIDYWRSLPNKHGWQGKAGLWKKLYSRETRQAIYSRHRNVFDVLGYGIEDMAENSPTEILEKWEELNGPKMALETSLRR